MKFNLKKPCADCPFRTDITPFLTPRRATEIADALLIQDATFACHKTVNYQDDEDGEEYDDSFHTPSADEEHCAGAMIFLELQNRANQLMRISERLGFYKASKLDMTAPVYRSKQAFVRAQRTGVSPHGDHRVGRRTTTRKHGGRAGDAGN